MARLALLSVSDKTGLVELAKTLVKEFGFDLISSGGTAKAIASANLPVTKVSDYTGSAVGSRHCIPRSTAVFWPGKTWPQTSKTWLTTAFARWIWWW